MPNFRALMTMPADGGDLVRAIRDETCPEWTGEAK